MDAVAEHRQYDVVAEQAQICTQLCRLEPFRAHMMQRVDMSLHHAWIDTLCSTV